MSKIGRKVMKKLVGGPLYEEAKFAYKCQSCGFFAFYLSYLPADGDQIPIENVIDTNFEPADISKRFLDCLSCGETIGLIKIESFVQI